jgi:uncharacterized repeat protein (TIGR02543 family)
MYDELGGSSIPDSTFLNGAAITLPEAPTKAGQQFDGWFTSTTGGTALGATYTPTGNTDVTLYARWSASAVTTAVASTTTANVAPTTTAPTVGSVTENNATTTDDTLPVTGLRLESLLGWVAVLMMLGIGLLLSPARRRLD